MSSLVFVMTKGFADFSAPPLLISARTVPMHAFGHVDAFGPFQVNRALTVPLLWSFGWGRLQVEGAGQVEGGLAQILVVQLRPQVEHIALGFALVAAEDVVVEVDAEGAAATVPPVDRAGAALLWAAPFETLAQTEVVEQALKRQLLF